MSYGLVILVFNFSDIKLSLVKNIYYLSYTPEKTNYNVKNMPLIYGGIFLPSRGTVCCGPGLVGRSLPKSPVPLFGPSPPRDMVRNNTQVGCGI